MNRHSFNKSYVLLLLLLSACARHSTQDSSRENHGDLEIYAVTPAGTEATDPYLTRDHRGNPVLCWTEKQASDSRYILKYAVFDTAKAAFSPAVDVGPSLGTKTSAESANKVAFKSDGTVIALFGKRFHDPRNRFAGAIQYCFSTDQGTSWSAPQYLHSDTLHHYGRGFFDIARLAKGELAAVWLDSRFGKADTGSALFFARTLPGGGFGMDKMIGQSTCECCRTDLLVDSAGIIHLAYRDILYPPAQMGKQVRDMVYTYSGDNGQTFRPPLRISADNWEVEGCPHSGPSLAAGTDGIKAVWFTAGKGTGSAAVELNGASSPVSSSSAERPSGASLLGDLPSAAPGLYYAALAKGSSEFTRRKLLSSGARHPQLISLPGGGIAIAWDEKTPEQAKQDHTLHSAHVSQEKQAQETHPDAPPHAAAPAIAVQLSNSSGEVLKTSYITGGGELAHHPVLTALAPGKLLLAWVQETKGIPGIKYSVVTY